MLVNVSSIPALTLLGLACLHVGTAQALQPDAGMLLDSTRAAARLPQQERGILPEEAPAEAPARPDTPPIAVKSFRITHNTAFPDAVLQALVADAVGKELTLGEIDAVAARITRHYRQAGYLVARAYLPAQEIRDGVVEIAVLEGRLGKLNMVNDSVIPTPRLYARLVDVREGMPLDGAKLERDLLLISDLPGVEVRSTLKPGASVGTTDLDVSIAPGARYSGDVELDNYGNRYTGEYRLGASFSAGNLLGVGDTLALRALASEGMAYGRLAWQFPVGWHGTQAGVAWSDMHYRLGRDFAALDAHGSARIGSVYLLHPFLRSRRANLNGQFTYEHKNLDDLIDSTATRTGKSVDIYTAGLSANRFDALGGGGLTQASIAYGIGQLRLDGASQALDAAGYRTAGSYGKLTYSLARLQRLRGDFSLYASLQGQAASKNLDSAERMSLGGVLAVRAYPQGEAACDDARLVNLELRYALAAWQASLFYDDAWGRQHHQPLPGDTGNSRRLSGYGFGLSYDPGNQVRFQTGIAWRDGPRPTSDTDRNPRLWASAALRF